MMSFLKQMRSPTSSSKTKNYSSTAVKIQRINVILQALGVSPSTASTHIYPHPETVHLIALPDLSYLAKNATLLVEHADVRCDFGALSLILWGMMRESEAHVDDTVAEFAARNSIIATEDRDGSSVAVPLATKTPSANQSAFALDSKRARGSQDSVGAEKSKTSHRTYALLHFCLSYLIHITVILQAFEGVPASPEVVAKRKAHVMQQDLDLVIRLSHKLVDLFTKAMGTGKTVAKTHEQAAAVEGADPPRLGLISSYSPVIHDLARALELNIGSLWLLLSRLSPRAELDMAPIIRLFSDEKQWAASGCGLAGTKSYCHSLCFLIHTLLLHRRWDFDNSEEIATRLVWQRLACRPVYQWRSFELLYFTSQQLPRAPSHVDNTVFGLLIMARYVQAAVSTCLTLDPAPTDLHSSLYHAPPAAQASAVKTQQEAAAKAARRAVMRHIGQLIKEGAGKGKRDMHTASFYQLFALAAVEGMPEADLTNNAALQRRAQRTQLTHEPAVLESPDALRLLLACAYTIPTSGDLVQHAVLRHFSTLALQSAVNRYILQQPGFAKYSNAFGGEQASNGRRTDAFATTAHDLYLISPLFVTPDLLSHKWIQLIISHTLQNIMNDNADTREVLSATVGKDTKSIDARNASPSAEKASELSKEPSSLPPQQELTPLAVSTKDSKGMAEALMQLVFDAINTIYAANDAHHRFYGDTLLHKESTQVSNGTRALWSMTRMAATLLFHYFETYEIPTRVNLQQMLDGMARVYALRLSSPIPTNVSAAYLKNSRRIMGRMQMRLAWIPQQMTPQAVQHVLTRYLVPLSASIQSTDEGCHRLHIAFVEAYLRSLATASAAFSISDDLLLDHWVDVALPCLLTPSSFRNSARPASQGWNDLAVAAHDFFIAPFLARKAVSALFAPTYVAVFIPTRSNSGEDGVPHPFDKPVYEEPSFAVVKRFATLVRAACQGLERCDDTVLQHLLESPSSLKIASLARTLPTYAENFKKLSAISGVLLVVSALFDKLCILWNATPGFVPGARQRFATYFSGLTNLLQCSNTQVLNRVCASIEAIEIEHLRGSGQIQLQLLQYIGTVVDGVQSNSKKGVAEWYLKLQEKVMAVTKERVQSKL